MVKKILKSFCILPVFGYFFLNYSFINKVVINLNELIIIILVKNIRKLGFIIRYLIKLIINFGTKGLKYKWLISSFINFKLKIKKSYFIYIKWIN